MTSTEEPIRRDRSQSMARTRRAILDAAVEMLRHDPAASMAAIAETAGTARSTLHRYFPERSDLIAALRELADEQVTRATERARLGEGTGSEALMRVCQEYFELDELIAVAYADFTQGDDLDSLEDMDAELLALVERGHADGTIDSTLSPEWIHILLWHLLDATWSMTATRRATKHEALTLCLRTLDKLTTPSGR
ncbi:helix-turn-helix domain-containing protein [Nesterenkonia sp. CL21]|uniref:TetR/AcrR family transcriptional regulator n=1 Tax=Nesterenkonia sp. CL21 TaxID=3064894 RepID=UPI002878C164|nr:helix-turn-helix domain-containing protein [Nesterenkonia sp. CL21]MDS2172380.1 helix-turn-helix domain-containing protein [Nesterenkonia sp. CL21]